jgi:sepiapterin reductase
MGETLLFLLFYSLWTMSRSLYIITGANRGFGEAIAMTLARTVKTPVRFILIGRNLATLQPVEHQLEQLTNVASVDLIAEIHGLDNAATTHQMILSALEPLVFSSVSLPCRSVSSHSLVFFWGG